MSLISLHDRSFARDEMDEMEGTFQMALVVVFAAVLLVTGQLFLEYRSSKIFDGPAVAAVNSRAVKIR
jgi:hypothetical protein